MHSNSMRFLLIFVFIVTAAAGQVNRCISNTDGLELSNDHVHNSRKLLSVITASEEDKEVDAIETRLHDEVDIVGQIIDLERDEDLTDDDQMEIISYLDELSNIIEADQRREDGVDKEDKQGNKNNKVELLDELEFEDDVSPRADSSVQREQLLEIVRTIDSQVDSEIDDEVTDIIGAASEGGEAMQSFMKERNLTFSKLLNDPVANAKDLAHFIKLANDLKVVNYTIPEKFQSRFFPDEDIITLNDDHVAPVVYSPEEGEDKEVVPEVTTIPSTSFASAFENETSSTTASTPTTTTAAAEPAQEPVGEHSYAYKETWRALIFVGGFLLILTGCLTYSYYMPVVAQFLHDVYHFIAGVLRRVAYAIWHGICRRGTAQD